VSLFLGNFASGHSEVSAILAYFIWFGATFTVPENRSPFRNCIYRSGENLWYPDPKTSTYGRVIIMAHTMPGDSSIQSHQTLFEVSISHL